MTVGSIMSTKIVMVEMDDSLEAVREIFEHVKFHHLLVMSGKRLMGVISDRDLLKSISPFVGTLSETSRDLATLQKRVHQIMSRQPISVPKDTTLATAAETMLNKNISCLPVTNEDGEIEGILTWKDLLAALLKQ